MGSVGISPRARVSRSLGSDPLQVSVVMPVLDGEAFVGEALESILGQTYAPAEIIVMDDGSRDRTPEIAASFAPSVRYVRQPTTRGIYGNANDGIALASGDLVAVVHADDVYLPTFFETEVAWLERYPAAGAVFCSDIFVDAEGAEFGRLELPPAMRGERPLEYDVVLNALLTYTNTFLRCPTALVRADVYRKLGAYRDEEFKNTSDLEMWLRIARRYPIGVLESHLVRYRRGHGSSSERYHRVRTDPFRFFEIMDRELDAGARSVATSDAIAAYEAHRAVDSILRAVSYYLLENLPAAKDVLAHVRLSRLARSSQVQRGRMIALLLALRTFVRLPRSARVARAFERRWHGGAPVGGAR